MPPKVHTLHDWAVLGMPAAAGGRPSEQISSLVFQMAQQMCHSSRRQAILTLQLQVPGNLRGVEG